MILGLGIDLVEVERIHRSLERFPERFLARILRPAEIAYCRQYKQPAERVAGHFAAKEAVSKAFGTGISSALGWHDMEIIHQASGEPGLVLHDAGQLLARQKNVRRVLVSISHTAHHATAVAILEGD